MSDDIRFERNAQAWLELGPVQAPDWVVRAALATVDTTPQRRTIRSPWRLPSVKVSPRFAMAAAVAIVVVAAGFLLWRNNQSHIAAPATSTPLTTPAPSALVTTAPSPLATPALSPRSIHDLLATKWLATADHVNPAAGGLYAGGGIRFTDTGLVIDIFQGPMVNPWAINTDGTLSTFLTVTQPVLDAAHWGNCSTGDSGTYQVSFSADEALVTLSAIEDACPTRAEILDGTWSRWPCPNPDSVCGAELSPGSHVTDLNPSPLWEGETGYTTLSSFSYAVPAGWSELPDAGLARPNDPSAMQVRLTLDVFIHARDCRVGTEGHGYNTARELVDYLIGRGGLVTTTPQPISIDGLSGLMFDVSVDPTWTQKCGRLEPGVFTFAVPIPPGPGVSFRDLVEGDAHARYIILDLSNLHNLLIEVDAPDEVSFNDLVQEAMPIIESFEFEREVH